MIDKRDILETATTLGLIPSVVEKDYVLGWLLAGINAHPTISESWIFKGGTCLKKCYFETYRFSEDLDFTLTDAGHIDEGFLKKTLGEIATWVEEASGLTVPADQIGIDIYQNPRGRLSCQGKIGYRGPVSPSGGGWPKIKLDLTADENLVLPHVEREVFHPYSDRPDDGIQINCYAYEEAFAEKVRALGERTRPRDLYDVVNLYRHTDSRPSGSVLLDVLRQKCAYKAIPIPTVAALQSHREALESMWDNMLAHQLPVLPPLADFWDALPEIFNWISGVAAAPQRAHIQHAAGEISVRSRVLPMAVPIRSRSALEIIRFAAANHLCVDLTYDGSVRRIEPYSLRQTAEGNFVIHATRSDSGDHRSYRVDRIDTATVTSQAFIPRYAVEITSGGPITIGASTARPRISRPARSVGRTSGPTYVYRCSYCRKTFNRRSMDSSLNAHKNPRGYPCPGRIGIYVRTKYS
ncbi:MAG TPA: nucleotidyl transferase AbiEii/AbiGii toxin family protein [Blastocatellia bacterium]|nr:nucleotidyl transferase AbiEii/AbiGii toxin family protein [Blastocatellia bacterium]